MKRTKDPRWQPLSRLPLVASMIDAGLADARNQHELLLKAKHLLRITCPRDEKKTAIGNHAGPVGSITTSSRVPSGVPASATCSKPGSRAVEPTPLDVRRVQRPALGRMDNTKDALFRFGTGVHKAIFRASRGRLLNPSLECRWSCLRRPGAGAARGA